MKRVLENAVLVITGIGDLAKGLSSAGVPGNTTGFYHLIPARELAGLNPMACGVVNFITEVKKAKPVINGSFRL